MWENIKGSDDEMKKEIFIWTDGSRKNVKNSREKPLAGTRLRIALRYVAY